MRAYRAALATAPNYGRAWYRLGVAELRRGDLAAAEQAFVTAARLEPRNASAANDLGVALLRQGRDGEAAAVLGRAAVLAPDHARAARNLSIALRRLGREAEADAALARVRALRPARLQVTSLRVTIPADVPLAYIEGPEVRAALTESRAGRVEPAIAAYRRALATAPDLAAANLGLGNELIRWRIAARRAAGPLAPAPDAEDVPTQTAVLFSDWLLSAAGGWSALEAVVEAPRATDERVPAQDARRHLEAALALGARAPAHIGLAALARLDGDDQAALRHVAAARAADASLPAGVLVETPTSNAASR